MRSSTWGAARRQHELERLVRQVRTRWRLKVLLRGGAVLVIAGFLSFFVSAWGMELFRFTPTSIVTFRVLTYVLLVAVAIYWIVLPLSRRISDQQVALYLEEHEPSLEATVISAVELARVPQDDARRGSAPELIIGLVEEAITRGKAVNYGSGIEKTSLYRSSGILATATVLALATILLGPGYLRHGASALLFPSLSPAAANPYSIGVAPGDVTIARGSDQTVSAQLLGFTADEVDLLIRSGDGEFEQLAMFPAADSGTYEILLFEVVEPTEYMVQSEGIQSSLFKIEVEDLPYVSQLEMVYHFPAYTGLDPRTVDDGGDIAVLRGTRVDLKIRPTVATPGGTLLVDDQPTALALLEDGSLTASLTVERAGFYRIELVAPNGQPVPASPQYTIDVLSDQPPAVSFVRPGRDTRASPIEEVFVEARADDDFGVASLELVYSVNGGEEQTVSLFQGGRIPLGEVQAGHTFFLEEWELEPGDVVAYHARASDNNRFGAETVTSDIYFLQIRPFRKDFSQAEQMGGPSQGGAGGGAETALSEQQRRIIAATFNLNRDQDDYTRAEFEENVNTVKLSQARLKDQVDALRQRMENRGVGAADPGFEEIIRLMPLAMEEMVKALERLTVNEPGRALRPEQRALQHLQRAEEVYNDVQIGMQQDGGGGGGNPSAEDLADLFELELDKLKNQYETVQRGEQQRADEQVDEALERLKELARRQEQEAERQRRASNRQGSPGSGASQRQLADETEEAARQLERLARQDRDPRNQQELQEAARRLQDAADAMRRSATHQGNQGAAEAGAALDRLRDARRRLEDNQSDRLRRDTDDALRRANRLAREQQEVQEDLSRMIESGQMDREVVRRLQEKKDEMVQELADIEQQLDRTAAASRRDQPDASTAVREAAVGIRESKLKERIQYSKGLVEGRATEYAEQFEEQTAGHVDELRDRLEEAMQAIDKGEAGPDVSDALDQARDLVRGMESLEERTRAIDEARRGERRLGDRGPQGLRPGQEQGEPSEGQQGQPGTAGQQPGGGQPGAAGQRPEDRSPTGGGLGGAGDTSTSGGFSPEDIRQFRREAQQRVRDAQELRDELTRQGVDASELSDVLRAMRRLDDQRIYDDVAEVARIQGQIVESLKALEYALRRQTEGAQKDELFLSGADEVPEGFRTLIEEYYRSLSRTSGGR